VVAAGQIRLNRTHLGVGGEDARPGEGLADVLQDDERLAHGAAAVEEHGHLPVHGVERQQQLALAAQLLLQGTRTPRPRVCGNAEETAFCESSSLPLNIVYKVLFTGYHIKLLLLIYCSDESYLSI
jgi:hypothetical protein